ncbi:MAG: M23 family metallopeptidase [Burkholderiaceae bacterium]
MQLLWVSGPTSSVKTFAITARHVGWGTVCGSIALILIGVVLQFVGFRIAIEFRPDFVRSIGGVTTESQQLRIEAGYREHLQNMRTVFNQTIEEIQQLEVLKNRFMELAKPSAVKEKMKPDAPRGGPFLAPRIELWSPKELEQDLLGAADEIDQLAEHVKSMRLVWQEQIQWLRTLPTGMPLVSEFKITSGFGLRADPFTGKLARHEGVDLIAPKGSPVSATADGVVFRTVLDPMYGLMVELKHPEGFFTRYAHLSKILVSPGQNVVRGDELGNLGNTGRSTGAHLHYEVIRHEQAINPRTLWPKNIPQRS